ncbi:MAG TPA: hypothetical protein PLN21_21420 [Gemmatales bacterium]|nr:hypothetical protein [Gemmatales bacterium]
MLSILLGLALTLPMNQEATQYRFEIKLYQGNPKGSVEKGDVELLSSPQILTRNEQEAVIKVGQKVPIITGRKEVGGKIVNTVEDQEVGISIKIKPAGSKDGILMAKLQVDISEVILGASAYPTINQQMITTTRELKLAEKVIVPFYSEKTDRQRGGIQANSLLGHKVWMEVHVTEIK